MSSELKANLEKFIAHCQDLKEEDDPSGDGFTREFRDLREKQVREKEENRFPAEEGKKPVNLKKNRYKDILPYDECRVILQGNEEGEDFINASYIQGANGEKNYIASQGPLPHTVNDFIRMLWQLKIEIIFMACRLEEGEPKKKKCEKYWTDLGESKEFGEITVKTESESLPMKDFYKRTICLSCNGSHHKVTQFHYIGWPDHGIPDHPSLLNIMINLMRVERKKHDIPLVIHCSAGCGRTGTICAIDYAWTLLTEGRIEKDFSLYEMMLKMREQRQSMVQTPDQYELVHLVMENLFTEWIKNYDLNNDVDTDQLYYNVENIEKSYNIFRRRCKTAPRTSEYENYWPRSSKHYENWTLPVLVRDPQSKNEDEDEYEEDIYVNDDIAADENIYTECDDSNNLLKPVVVPTNQYYSNVNQKETNQSAAQNTKPVVPTNQYNNVNLKESNQSAAQNTKPVVPTNQYNNVNLRESNQSAAQKTKSVVPTNQYNNVNLKETNQSAAQKTKSVIVPTNQYYSYVDVKETNQSAAQKARNSSHVSTDNGELSKARTDSSSSSLNESTVVGDMYSMVDTHKKEIEKPVMATTKISSDQPKEMDSPMLPPRKYTEEEIRSTKPDKNLSHPPETPLKESKPVVFAPRRHAVKSANPSPTGTVSSRGNVQPFMYHDKRYTPDGLHKTTIQVQGRSGGVRRQPVQQPMQQIRFKVGREQIIVPNGPPPGMAHHPPPSMAHHPHPGMVHHPHPGMAHYPPPNMVHHPPPNMVHHAHPHMVPVHDRSGKHITTQYIHPRDYHGHSMGYNNQPVRRPNGVREPDTFQRKQRNNFH